MTRSKLHVGTSLFAIVVLVAMAGVLAWVSDDAYISMRTVDNWFHGYGLRWNIAERVQAFTHPLWVFVLSLFYALTHEPYYASIAAGLVVTAAFAAILFLRISQSALMSCVLLVACASSNAFLDFATSGLENPLTNLLIAAFIVVFLGQSGREGRERRTSSLVLLVSLALLVRHDNALILAPALAYEVWMQGWRRSWRPFLIASLPFLAWEVFSIIYFGFPFPNTAYAKLGTGFAASWSIRQGILYLGHALTHDPVTVLVPLAAIYFGLREKDRKLALLASGVALHVLYTVRIGGDFMAGRFLVAPFVASLVILAHRDWRALGLTVAGTATVVVALLGSVRPVPLGGSFHREQVGFTDGIAHERWFYFKSLGLIKVGFNKRGPAHFWRAEAERDRLAGAKLNLRGNIGIYGYYAGPSIHIVDMFALSDPLLARMPPVEAGSRRIGHIRRYLPNGYVQSLEDGTNHIAHPELAAYFEALQLITTAPLWSWERWAAIWNMNLGRYQHLVSGFRPENDPPLRLPYSRLIAKKPEATRWDCAGCVILGQSGVIVAFPKAQHAPQLELSLDHNDSYQIEWLDHGKSLASSITKPSSGVAGLAIVRVDTPQSALSGFDGILVKPLTGDSFYSLGHLALLTP